MALNTALSTLRTMLKAEVGDNLSVGTQMDSTYNQLLATKQTLLAAEFDFPYLHDFWDVNVVANTRYYNFPTSDYQGLTTDMDLSRPFRVFRYFNLLYNEIVYGIGQREYNFLNPTLGRAADPIQNWRWMQTAITTGNAGKQFEVWPLPVTSTTSGLRFEGQRALGALASDSDKADIDDVLLVLSVAVEVLAKRRGPDAQLRLQNASRRLSQLRNAMPVRQIPPCVMGGRESVSERHERLASMKIIAVTG